MASILICHHGALGDFVLTWPALYHLRNARSPCQIFGVGRGEYMELAVRYGLIDRYRDIESAAGRDFINGRANFPGLPPPDAAVLWLNRGAEVARLLKKSACMPVTIIRPFPAISYSLARYYCAVLHRDFHVPRHCRLAVPLPVPRLTRNYAVIHPGSGSVTKNYSPGFYHTIADSIRARGIARVAFVLGPAELDRCGLKAFDGQWIVQPQSVGDLADFVTGALVCVGNDSGVSHLAAILGVPTISLYKSTDPKIWGTVGARVRHITGVCEKKLEAEITAYLHEVTPVA